MSNLCLLTEISLGKCIYLGFIFLPQVKVHVDATVGLDTQADER